MDEALNARQRTLVNGYRIDNPLAAATAISGRVSSRNYPKSNPLNEEGKELNDIDNDSHSAYHEDI